MGDVVTLVQPDDFKGCTYFDTRHNHIGLKMRDDSLGILREPEGKFRFVLNGNSNLYSREELAEFIHTASVLIDDEQRWMPEGKLVACNYFD